MKTTTVLTQIIPTLNAVRGSGAYNVVIAGRAGPLAEDLRKAANDDRLNVNALLLALEGLAQAAEFEAQQQAMEQVLHFADTLLGEIANGTAPQADRISHEPRDLIQRINEDVASIRDVFSPKAEVMNRIRANASELASLVDAEVFEGRRPGEHATYAAIVFDHADRLAEEGHRGREAAGTAIIKNIQLLAA